MHEQRSNDFVYDWCCKLFRLEKKAEDAIFCSLFHFFQIFQMMKLSYMNDYCEMYKFNLLSQATTTSFKKKLQRKIRNYVNYFIFR